MPNIALQNDGIEYVKGLGLAHTDDENITIAAGECRDSTNVNDIVLSAQVTVDGTVTGANGLDTGSFGNNTFYAVYLIGDSTGYKSTAGIFSADLSEPSLPTGYDMFRLLGYVLTDGSADLLAFSQTGDGLTRVMWYDTLIQELSGGSATSFTDIDLGGSSVPDLATNVILVASITPNSAANKIYLRENGSGATNGNVQLSGVVASQAQVAQLICPCDGDSIIEYKVDNGSDSASVWTAGYMYNL